MTNEEAKIALANLKRYMSGGGVIDRETNKAIDMAVDALGKSEPRWIPVTERLPKSAEDDLEYPTVLVCFDNGDVDTACFYESTREWGCGDMYDRICHPTAWMPLPEAFKGVTT